MTMREPTGPEPSQGIGHTRRDLLKRAAAVGLATGGLIVASQAITATPAHAQFQSGWRYCWACKGLVWSGSAGVCPSPDYTYHQTSGSYNYIMYYPVANAQEGPFQNLWRYCRKCKGMFYPGGPPNDDTHGGFCLVQETEYWHDGSVSYNYMMPLADSTTIDRQGNWRWCAACGSMFWGGAEASSYCPLATPSGVQHVGRYSDEYFLNYTV